MKKILIIFSILSFVFVNAQFNKGIVYFKDTTTLEGLIKVKAFDGIKFKAKEDAEPINYNHGYINGYDVNGWQFRYVKKDETATPKLYKLILEGKISLYSKIVGNPDPTNSNASSSGITLGYTPDIYYIKTDQELIKVTNNLKKKQLRAFTDCPRLIEKINNKEFKKWDLYDIVEFYNEDCE